MYVEGEDEDTQQDESVEDHFGEDSGPDDLDSDDLADAADALFVDGSDYSSTDGFLDPGIG